MATSFVRSTADLDLQKPLNWLPANGTPVCLEPQNLGTPATHTLYHGEREEIKTALLIDQLHCVSKGLLKEGGK